MKTGMLVINPVPKPEQMTTSSVDLCLGDEMFSYKSMEEIQGDQPKGAKLKISINTQDLDQKAIVGRYAKPVALTDGHFVLYPGQFALSSTREYVHLKHEGKLAARVEGRSSLARLGLVVHLTAPTIHAGFSGRIVLEMYNFGPYPLELPPGVNVCQLIIERLGTTPSGKPTTQFQGQTGVR